MSIVTGDITAEGAVVGVMVEVSANRAAALRRSNMPVPQPIVVSAIIDTGSFLTFFARDILESLGIQPFDRVKLRTPSTQMGEPHLGDVFHVTVFLASETAVRIPIVRAVAADDFGVNENARGLIGRDILNRCTFEYFGYDRRFRLSF